MNIDFFMNEAIKEAKKAKKLDEVPIGGVLVDNISQNIIVRGHNRVNKSNSIINHCEIHIIFEACKKLQSKYLNNTTMFISLEPCTMCAAAISKAHISKVYFGSYDNKFGGMERLILLYKKNKIYFPETYGGILEKESSNLLKEFFKEKRKLS